MPGTADVLKHIEKSPIRKLAALLDAVKNRQSMISLGGGAPSLPPPAEVIQEITQRLNSEPLKTSAYTGTRGLPELRQALCADVKKETGLDVDYEQEIIVTDGASEALTASLMALVNPGDEVIITNPTYLGYAEGIKLVDGKPVELPVYVDDGFQPDVDEFQKLITSRTKVVILLSPDNPTGRVIEKERAKAIVDLAADHDFWVIVDETYNHILYDAEPYWIATFNDARERTLVCSTFSKVASMPGYRFGYVYGPSHVIDGIESLKQYLSLCPSSIGQYAALKFLTAGLKHPYLKNVVIPTYRERRDTMGRCLREMLPKAITVKPSGAFYYFVNMNEYLNSLRMDDEAFAQKLLQEAGVVVIPGQHFGSNGRNHVRLTFVSEPPQRIMEGILRMEKFLSESGVE